MTKTKTIAKKLRSNKRRTFKIVKDGESRSSYYVTRTENGEVLDRTRVIVPAPTNLFFGKSKKERERSVVVLG